MKNANHGAIDNQQLLSIIERIEKLNEDSAAIAADIKEIYSEAKSAGFDPKYIRQMIRLRKLDPDELDEADELTQMYRNALGIGYIYGTGNAFTLDYFPVHFTGCWVPNTYGCTWTMLAPRGSGTRTSIPTGGTSVLRGFNATRAIPCASGAFFISLDCVGNPCCITYTITRIRIRFRRITFAHFVFIFAGKSA